MEGNKKMKKRRIIKKKKEKGKIGKAVVLTYRKNNEGDEDRTDDN